MLGHMDNRARESFYDRIRPQEPTEVYISNYWENAELPCSLMGQSLND